MKKPLDKTFFKFIMVGVANTLLGMGIMFVLYNLFQCSYWVSGAANYVCGSILSYFLNKHFTFKYTQKGWKPVLRFALSIAVCYLIAYGVAKPAVRALLSGCPVEWQDNGAMLVGAGLYVILNYFGQRFFAFRKNAE